MACREFSGMLHAGSRARQLLWTGVPPRFESKLPASPRSQTMTSAQLQPTESYEPTLVGSAASYPTASRGLRAGTVIAARYELGRLLGSGGMGLVYEAKHLVLGTTVAIKVLRPELSEQAECVERFMGEARCLAALSGEHVVRILDAGRLETGLPFLVMELLTGRDLSALIKACGWLAAPIAVDYALQACAGLAEAHAIGLVHRDIKPANLFLASRRVGATRIKVIDFGIATWVRRASAEGNVEAPEGVLGSPSYSSPEQLEAPANIDSRSDVWSLGVVLFEMLTGACPFSRASGAEPSSMTPSDATPDARSLRPELDRRLAAVVGTCLERASDRRFPSAKALASALSPFGSDRLSSSEDLSLSPYEVSDEEAAWLRLPWGGPKDHARRLSA